MSETADILRRAKARLSGRHWCTDVLAADKDGWEVEVDAPNAVRWCAVGALYKEEGKSAGLPAYKLLTATAFEEFGCWPYEVNDNHGKRAVMRLYDMAIAAAEAQS